MKKLLISLSILILPICSGRAQELITYKQIDTLLLQMKVIQPDKIEPSKKYPAMVFFFGGGWVGGTMSHFERQANHFAKRGLVCFLVDYRVKTRNNTTPFESLKDAKTAMRFVRANAEKFNIDKDKIIASGGSAGGHLAAATALIEGFNEESDDVSISCIPNALVLFNPVFDNGPGGYGFERVGEHYKDFSPLHNIKAGAPPTIVLLGTKDRLIPVETAKYYKVVMEKVGSRCDLFLYEGQGHGFFNYKEDNSLYFDKTLAEADTFLVSLGYIE